MANKWKKAREKRRLRREENIVFTKRVRCGSDLHRIGLTKRGTVVMFDHTRKDIDDAETLEALGHRLRCLEIYRNWYRLVKKASINESKIPRDMFYDVPREMHEEVRRCAGIRHDNKNKSRRRKANRETMDPLHTDIPNPTRRKYFLTLAAENTLRRLWPDTTFQVVLRDTYGSELRDQQPVDKTIVYLNQDSWKKITLKRRHVIGEGFCLNIETEFGDGSYVAEVAVRQEDVTGKKLKTRRALVRGKELSWQI